MTAKDPVTVTYAGRELIADWHKARTRLENAEREKNYATNHVENATRKLAEWLLPKDAKPGEQIGIWCRDQHGNERLYLATKDSAPHSDKVEIRDERKVPVDGGET